eukprot:559608-Pelagomonas_calceolata.AAC.12
MPGEVCPHLDPHEASKRSGHDKGKCHPGSLDPRRLPKYQVMHHLYLCIMQSMVLRGLPALSEPMCLLFLN